MVLLACDNAAIEVPLANFKYCNFFSSNPLDVNVCSSNDAYGDGLSTPTPPIEFLSMPLGEQLLQMSNTSHKINVYLMFQKDFHELYVLALLQLIQFQFLLSLKFFLSKKFGKRSGNLIEHFKMSRLLSFHRLKQLLALKGK